MSEQISIDLTNDPRPEKEKDSKVWEFVFKKLENNNNFRALASMYALRLNGCELEYRDEENEVKFNMNTVTEEEIDKIDESDLNNYLSTEQFQTYIKDIIKPQRDKIKPVLNEVAERARASKEG